MKIQTLLAMMSVAAIGFVSSLHHRLVLVLCLAAIGLVASAWKLYQRRNCSSLAVFMAASLVFYALSIGPVYGGLAYCRETGIPPPGWLVRAVDHAYEPVVCITSLEPLSSYRGWYILQWYIYALRFTHHFDRLVD